MQDGELPAGVEGDLFDPERLRWEASTDPVVEGIASATFKPAVPYSTETTFGTWDTEEDAAKEFDRLVMIGGLFRNVYREIPGFYVQPKMFQTEKKCRIDRILMPSPALIEAGWEHGPIGVELEASRRKVAGPIEQLMDYTRAAWTIEKGYHILIERFFLWPWCESAGNVLSLAVQHRIGGISISWEHELRFWVGSTRVIGRNADGSILARKIASGKKSGHRARA